MHKYCWLFLFVCLFSCHDKKPSLADNQPVDATDFFAAFPSLKLPYNTADTSLSGIGDTTTISLAVLEQFIPDSALKMKPEKGNGSIAFHPVGKIESKNNLYVLLLSKQNKKSSLTTYLFEQDKKKTTYKNQIGLLTSGENDGYNRMVDINSEPTFTITKSKTTNGQYVYSRNGYAYSPGTGSFIEVINESNDDAKKSGDIINPIDTLAKSFRYSGDYTKDKTNFISVRDGNIPGRYTFFLHFEKNKGECVGELKGTLSMIGADKAVFQQSGDPCVMDFTFSANSVKVMERGSCGNHRGITCQFDDTYKKKTNNPALKESRKTKSAKS